MDEESNEEEDCRLVAAEEEQFKRMENERHAQLSVSLPNFTVLCSVGDNIY